MDGCWLYILRCADGSYYVGTTRHADVATRVAEHESGWAHVAYIFARRPVVLVFAEWFDEITAAVAMERQVKGWRREKKEALIDGARDRLPALARGPRARPNGQDMLRLHGSESPRPPPASS
jgi:putative endonuclease